MLSELTSHSAVKKYFAYFAYLKWFVKLILLFHKDNQSNYLMQFLN